MTEEFCFDECKHCLLMILLVVTSPAKAAQEMFLDRLQTHCVRSHISLAKKLATKAEGRGAWIPCNSQMPWKECEGINFFTECKMCGGLSMAETTVLPATAQRAKIPPSLPKRLGYRISKLWMSIGCLDYVHTDQASEGNALEV
jgi:hypothetical protein